MPSVSISDMEEREVDEAEARGESLGEPRRVAGAEASVSTVFEVAVRRMAWRVATPEAVPEAMLATEERQTLETLWERRREKTS